MPPQPQQGETYTFKGQRPGEEILVVTNRHTWSLLPIALIWLLIVVAIGLSIWYFGASAITSVVIGALVVFGVIFALYRWYLWSFSSYIITNQRVVKIDLSGVFNRRITEAEIGRIQEISTEIAGPVHTLLNFGTIKIQTASTVGRIELEDVPDPYSLQQEIVRVQRQLAAHPGI
jgi:membrane protein YdbS with pleckstrin-like domain